MFPNPISLLQASMQNLLVFGNADADFSEYSELHEIYKKTLTIKSGCDKITFVAENGTENYRTKT